jgi:hypothetical protein
MCECGCGTPCVSRFTKGHVFKVVKPHLGKPSAKKFPDTQVFILHDDLKRHQPAAYRYRELRISNGTYACDVCNQLPIHNGRSLTLTVDHINGLKWDDTLDNLRVVCPNCDTQLETHGSKNISNLENFRKDPLSCFGSGSYK